ncbi:alpha-2-macroglobulin family protein [Spirochaetota bacterium]
MALALISCSKENIKAYSLPDPAYVVAHSNGIVSRYSEISVVFSDGRDTAKLAGKNPFSFYPDIKGQVVWSPEGDRIDFAPEKPLKAGQSYKCVFDFSGIGEAQKGWFSFNIKTKEAGIVVKPGNLFIARDGSLALSGTLESEELSENAAFKEIVKAVSGKKKLDISWKHDTLSIHEFTVHNIPRSMEEGSLLVFWDGKPLGSKNSGKAEYRIPKDGSFEVLAINPPGEDGTSGISIAFSEILDPNQDLRGLVRSNSPGALRFETDGSILKLYSSLRWPEELELSVERGVKSITGAMVVPVQAVIQVAWDKPEVRFQPGGVIVPTSQGTKVILETKNLAKVYVEALQVYKSNMLQFLQINDLDGKSELKRVGDVVWRAEIDLDWSEDKKNQWTSHALDLSALTEKYGAGLFQLRVAFGREHIRYVSPNNFTSFGKWKFPPVSISDNDDEYSYWDYAEEWFDWTEYYRYRNDPAHPAFYIQRFGNDRSARRNILVSDIALSAKQDSLGTWHVALSNMKTAKSVSGASISLYSYSMRELVKAVSDKNGFAIFGKQDYSPDGHDGHNEPFFIVAEADKSSSEKKGKDQAYLKISPSQALSVSHFDIAGEKAESGIKGFIYGERGVWRPGDDIHLGFILYDNKKTLPKEHPVQFELANPLGQIVKNASYTNNLNGVYYIKTSTDYAAPTGNWLARIRLGGKSFEKSLKIEAIMPNRLKLKLDYGKDPWISSDTKSMTLSAAWLHGAAAPGLKADVNMYLLNSAKAPGNYSSYSFQDPLKDVPGGKTSVFEGSLDSRGLAQFNTNFSAEQPAPGPMTAMFVSRAFERSGLFSTEQFSVDYHPYKRYVGIKLPGGDSARNMLLTDKDHNVEFILVDRDGKAQGNTQLEIALYKLEWRWWWEKGEESLAAIASDVYRHLIKKDTLELRSGRASWKLNIKYPEWGRYLLRVSDKESGHSSGSIFYVDWPGWAGQGKGEGAGSASMLELASDKEKYSPGSVASISFPSNKEGRAMVTIEKSGHILKEEWVEAKDAVTEYKFKITADMAPNVYVHISYIQPHLQSKNDLPIRLYGIIPVMVEDPQTRLEPLVSSPAALEPMKKSVISVSERSGKAMTYTLAVVEEGLLGITRYSVPNPWNEFYKKEASSLASWDVYKDVAGAYSGKLQTLISIGGSEFEDLSGTRKSSRFPPVVQFFGPFELAKGANARHEIELGPYNGAVRLMVVAADPNGAYGCTEKEVPVRTDLMTFMTVPRVLGPGESLSIPVSVFAFLGKNAKVDLQLSVSGALGINGQAKKTLVTKVDGEETVNFQVKAAETSGEAGIRLTATAPGGKSYTESVNLEVRSSAIPVTMASSVLLDGKTSGSLDLALPGIAGSNEAWLELSLLPPVDLSGRLAYLLDYPHGCCEQTVSKAFPQLFLAEAMPLSPEQAETARANVASAIGKMSNFQLPRGGFSFWPGAYEEGEWLSAYVSHFLIMAKAKGYALPEGMLENAIDWLKSRSSTWNAQSDYSKAEQAYRLYVLSIAGQADIAGLNRFMEYAPFPAMALYQYAAAYAVAGFRDKAQALLTQAAPTANSYDGMERIYASLTRDRAAMLDALNAIGDSTRGITLYRQIAQDLASTRPLSTQDLSFALISALPYIRQVAASEARLNYSYKGSLGSISVTRGLARVPLAVADDMLKVNLENVSSQAVYARLVAVGTPKPGTEKPMNEGLSLGVQYLDASGAVMDPATAPFGSDLVAEITVSNLSGENIDNIALTYRLASGWEIGNLRIGMDTGSNMASAHDYQDFRDDRVMTYFSLKSREKKTYRFFINKSYEGDFVIPAISAEAMYKPEYYALWPGSYTSKPPSAPKPGSSNKKF